VRRYQKGKTNLDLLKQETVNGCGISWAICKSAPRSSQITMPVPHRSVFYRPDALPASQPTVSKYSRLLSQSNKTKFANRKKIQFSSYKYFLIISYAFRAWNAFSALTMLIGRPEEHSAYKNLRDECGYLSEVRCRLFAYGPADATAIPKPHQLLPHLNPDWFYLSGTGLPRLSWKRGH